MNNNINMNNNKPINSQEDNIYVEDELIKKSSNLSSSLETPLSIIINNSKQKKFFEINKKEKKKIYK